MKIEILWQNEHAVLVDKPAEVLSVPARTKDDPRPVLGLILQEQLGQPIFPVHRLDFEVSGVMVFALTKVAHQKLNLGFEKKMIKKTYLALTETPAETQKEFPVGPQVWKRKILRGKKRSYESPVGEQAETRALVLDKTQALWQLEPVTGKPHQLRLELYLQGFPILGDQLYNSKKPWSQKGIALRSHRIEFPESIVSEFGLPKFQEVSPWT